jgi:enterochelin esterase family protein
MSKNSLHQRLEAEGNPLIDGKKVTFLWAGEKAPYLIDDLHNWEQNPQSLQRIDTDPSDGSGQRMWAYSFDLPSDAYLEYVFLDLETNERLRDPHNKRRIWNGVNGYNHFFYMPDAAPTPLVRRKKGVPRGALTKHRLSTWMMSQEGKRIVHLYQPPTDGPVPLLVVYDGNDYLQRGKLAIMVDNLIAEKRIRPLAMIFLQNGGPRRFVEYACSEATLAWLDHDVLPLAHERLDLLDIKENPGAYGMLGASMGGLMALYTGLRMPEVFGKVLSQSGAFHFEQFDTVTVEMVQHFPKRDLRIWMDAGKFDFLLESNQGMYKLLNSKGYDVSYREFTGAHCYTAWRNDIWHGLETLFGMEK